MEASRPPPYAARLRRRTRPLNVDEALQYSPFSSIVPFGPEPIPLPNLRPATPTPLFSTPSEHTAARKTLEDLDQRIYSNNNSPALRQTIQDLQRFLDPDELTEFNFKAPPVTVLPSPQESVSNGTNGQSANLPSLGSFSEMVLKKTDVAYRYPTPSTPGSRSIKSQSTSRPVPVTPTKSSKLPKQSPSRRKSKQDNSEAFHANQQTINPALLTPGLSASSNHGAEILSAADPPSANARERQASHSHSRRSVDDVDERGNDAIGYRKSSQASFQSLQDLIGDIFESEDQLQADTSGATSTSAQKFFVDGSWSDGKAPSLSPAVLVKLDSSVQRVISEGRFHDVPIDDLTRLQRLCDGTLKSTESLDLKFEDEWSEDDYQQWLWRIESAETGLKAARTILRIMSGGREEKHLCSEEMLQSILRLLKNVLETCIIPVVELRSTGSRSETFKALSSHVKPIIALLNYTSKIMKLLAHLLGKEEVTESVITTVEFVASGLIFVENSHVEKESVLGVQRFERLRVTAMDVLVTIFSKHPDQRTFIFDEVLTSLERLPVTRQGARHFKLNDGGNIQLVSALIMRLVQTSAMQSDESKADNKANALALSNGQRVDVNDEEDAEGEEDHDLVGPGPAVDKCDSEDKAQRHPERAFQELAALSGSLFESAQKNAHYVIHFLVSRALKSTKSGDDPYRVLLDIFTEDFITVLGSADWPSAELLLRLLLTSMIGIAEGEKSPAPAKNMALDLMGLMGSAISDLAAHIRQSSKVLENSETGLDSQLGQLTDGFLEGTLSEDHLLVWLGPFRATLEYLQQQDLSDGQIESARGYYTTQWAFTGCSFYQAGDEEDQEERMTGNAARLAFRLNRMIMHPKWLEDISDFGDVTTTQGRLAYTLTLLNMPFPKAFERILLILLNSMNSDQATVRSKSMKSVIQLLEKDPTILDRGAYVMRSILARTCDPSPLVRDSAVGLVGKCLTLKPVLEDEVWESILVRVSDAQVGVRKRSMKILKEIYLRNARREVKSAVADALLHRVKDADDGVCEVARLLLEEIWISPFHRPLGQDDETIPQRLALTEQIFLIIKTVQGGESVSAVLGSLLQTILSNQSKTAAANFRVCKSMVAVMFDEILDDGSQPGKPSQAHILRTLTVFAKANAKLFTGDQLELLQPYLENLSTTDDLHVYRSVVIIFRWVLPQLPSLKSNVLFTVQGALLGSLSKLGKRELNEVVPCLWTINGLLKNTERLSRATISCLKGVYGARQADLAQSSAGKNNMVPRVVKYISIASLFGKYCDFSKDVARFRAELPWWRGDSVPGLMIDVFAPFTRPKQPLPVRSAALESLGAVCHASPKAFLKEQVYTAFDIVFASGNQELESIVLTGFQDFLASEEQRSETGTELPTGDDADFESGRLGGALTANQNDGVSSSIAQRYLQHIIRIATATQDNHAMLAVELIGSISRQGLLHPKECGPVLVALETSKNPAISSIAFREHRTLHQKHETVLEKEYVKAVQQAFRYQRDIIGDARGASFQPFVSKLRPLFDVIKISKGKVRKKFLSSLCGRIDFDQSRLDISGQVPTHLQYARFVAENMAFFEYNTVDEVLHVIFCIERVVAGTGTGVAHAIETELLGGGMEDAQASIPEGSGQMQVMERPVDEASLKRSATASAILSILWDVRSYLRRTYGFKNRDLKARMLPKDLNRMPIKIPGVSGEKLWEDIDLAVAALENPATMMAQCKRFVELLSVDHELKLAAEGDDELAIKAETPSEDEADGTPAPPGGSGKARKRKGGSETPGKRGKKWRRLSSSKAKQGSDDEDDQDWAGGS